MLSISADRSLHLREPSLLATSNSPPAIPITPVTLKRTSRIDQSNNNAYRGSVATLESIGPSVQISERLLTTLLSVKKRAHVVSTGIFDIDIFISKNITRPPQILALNPHLQSEFTATLVLL